MTLLAGLVHHDGIAVVADRASIDPFRQLAPGMFAPGAPVTKVFASTSGDTIAGIAGTAVVPGVNLLRDLQAAVNSPTSHEAHARLIDALAKAAPTLRAHASLSAEPLTPFAQPVHVVLLLGSRTALSADPASSTQLVAYGVADTGPPLFQSLQRSAVYAPASVQADAERLLQHDAPAGPLEEQVAAWGPRLRVLAPLSISRQQLDLSADFNSAAITQVGNRGVQHHAALPPPTSYRH